MSVPASLAVEETASHACWGGRQGFYRHSSQRVGLPMRFGLFVPPGASTGRPVPILLFLAGLTCNEETFAIKAGAQRRAAELGIALLTPDTSPRQTGIDGATQAWDFGEGAGFYLDATAEPWRRHWQTASWLTRELLDVVAANFAVDAGRVGIAGHSMGGHGALTLALNHPSLFASVSAFAPIAAPMRGPWGRKAFTGYLGPDERSWAAHDAAELVRQGRRLPNLLVDQGLADPHLQTQLGIDTFEAACREAGQPLTLRRHDGYDHGYFFVQSFIADHLEHHARYLLGA